MKKLIVYAVLTVIGVLIISFSDSQKAIISDKLDTIERSSRDLQKQVSLLKMFQDSLLSDKDSDGVSDYFDKEPDTPEGYMVYGGGQAVDQDKDGVADDIDEDPYSTRGANVDANGRELDDDGDSVPNEHDLEPDSKPGAFVNYQGVTITDKIGGGSNIEDISSIPGFIEYRDFQDDELAQLKNTVLGYHSSAMGNRKDTNVEAQGRVDKKKSGVKAKIENACDKNDSLHRITNPVINTTSEPSMDSLRHQYNLSLLKHKMRAMEHRNGVFEWQLFSGKLIFGIVLLIVFIGLLFSWLQFKQVLSGTTTAEKVEGANTMNTEMEISKSGLKINSSVIGLIILVLSLAFFYLYLIHVYPIEMVPTVN